jgi:glycoside/pentoside/hexuronide:cation symporter, GPH family|tara:strand:- start:206 stop:1582 length:1377 start_codon:yes stop_codon:yes gene_type:complete
LKLSNKTLFAFAFLNLPLSLGGLPLGLYLTPYYASEFGISLSMIGVIIMLTRITDVITDPLIGTLSDRTPAKYGRRGLWILIGMPIMSVAVIAVFDPFFTPTPLYLFTAVALLYFGWTLIGIPLTAWIAEISSDYNERSRITGARTWGGIVGSLVAIAAPLILAGLAGAGFSSLTPETPGSLQPMLRVLAWSSVIFLFISVPYLLLNVPQPRFKQTERVDLKKGFRLILQNQAFRRLLIANVLGAIGWNSINTLFIFFVTLYLLADASQWPIIIVSYLMGQFVGTPLIMTIASRFNKHRLLAVSSLISSAIFSLVLLFQPGDYVWYIVLNFFTGILAPANAILAPSMAADVIDQDTLESGEQRGALFMALWGMADKFAIAAAAGITLPLVQYLGFDPLIQNDPDSLKVLQYSFCFVPICFFILSVGFLWNYPLTRERHGELREALTRKNLLAQDMDGP